MEGVTIINYLCSSPQLYWGLLAFLPYCFSIDSELKDGNFTISQGKKVSAVFTACFHCL